MLAVAEDYLAAADFQQKAGLLVEGDQFGAVGGHVRLHPVQVQLAEGVSQQQLQCFGPKLRQLLRLADAELKDRRTVVPEHVGDAHEADQTTVGLQVDPEQEQGAALFRLFLGVFVMLLELECSQWTCLTHAQCLGIVQVVHPGRLNRGVLLRVDGRGSGKSPGQCEPWSLAESIDFYDAIEWAAAQPWCSGKVGLSGISYFAINQWFAANHQPPSLSAIIPWEGFADLYRDALFHGGLLSLFMPNWYVAHLMHHVVGRASRHHPNAWQTNTLHFWLSNNLDTGVFHGAQAQWDKIDLPMWAVGNWSGMGLHLRGATEGYMRAASKHKKLRIHCGTHFHPFYSEDGRRDQLRFFDYWLKDVDNGVMQEPPVKLAIRTGHGEYHFRHENEWPLARTQWTKLYLDFSKPDGAEGKGIAGTLAKTKPAATTARTYSASSAGELQKVFADLPTYLITREETMEISVGFAALGALLAAIAVALSLMWHPLP